MENAVRKLQDHRKLYTIGQVLTVLKPEFGDLSPSKLRFLEDQGLVTPERTDAGYRKYSENQIERL
ncbi:MerR family transcriptional regulator, partial [Aquiluna sp.]|nr:MerR family transcriptional regulator [Aquiluna sp.]